MGARPKETNILDMEATRNFQEYLRIESVHPDINYEDCVQFLIKLAKNLELPVKIYQAVVGKPVVIITWLGTVPTLPSIMFNSHMDVVPVFEDKWEHEPFGAKIDSTGRIYGRGTQDMKSVGIQYLEAIKRLKRNGVRVKRTIHVTFVPDEEIGGADGMAKFVTSAAFREMGVGIVYDEGMASEDDNFILFYGEKSIWQFNIHCIGTPGHAAMLYGNTAAEKLQKMLNKILSFRELERKKLDEDQSITIADVTTINLTQLKGGIQPNVIPPEFTAVFDCRLPSSLDFKEWEATLQRWCSEVGEGVRIEYVLQQPPVPLTILNQDNPEWIALKEVMLDMGIRLKTMVCPGSTDAKFIRRAGLPAFGFSPINNTDRLLHGHDEYLSISTFLKGIKVYYNIIEKIGNLEY